MEEIRHFFIDSFCCQCRGSFRLHSCRDVFFLQPGGQRSFQCDLSHLSNHTASNQIRYKRTNQVYTLRQQDRRIIIAFTHWRVQRTNSTRRHLICQPFIRGFGTITDCLACGLQTFTDSISHRVFPCSIGNVFNRISNRRWCAQFLLRGGRRHVNIRHERRQPGKRFYRIIYKCITESTGHFPCSPDGLGETFTHCWQYIAQAERRAVINSVLRVVEKILPVIFSRLLNVQTAAVLVTQLRFRALLI
ncbi:hypothetical protein ESCOMA044M4_25975 [Escherichia coli]